MGLSLYPHAYYKQEEQINNTVDKWQEIFENSEIADKLEAVEKEAAFLVNDEDEQAIVEYAEHMAVFVQNLPHGALIIEEIKGGQI